MNQRTFEKSLFQLQHKINKFQKLLDRGTFNRLSYKKRQQWICRIQKLKSKLTNFLHFQPVKKGVLGATTILCLALGNTAEAQNFGTLQFNPFGLTAASTNSHIDFADIDNDGDFDAISSGNNANLRFFENIGGATVPNFIQVTVNSPLANISGYGFLIPSLVDIDNDGDFDIFTTDYNGEVGYVENIGSATNPIFSTTQTNPFGINTSTLHDLLQFEFVDIDNDGDFDIFTGASTYSIAYIENVGTATTPSFNAPILNPFGITSQYLYHGFCAFTDIDNDGDFDLFVESYGGFIKYFENIGTVTNPIFDTSQLNPFNFNLKSDYTYAYKLSPVFVDIDNDGDDDLFAGSSDYGADIFFQEQNSNTPPTSADTIVNINEDTIYHFSVSNFPFNDANSNDALVKIKIWYLPSTGTFLFNGLPVTLSQEIMATDLENLTFEPYPGQYSVYYTNLEFKVSDGKDYSNNFYTLDINVNALPSTVQTTVETYENTDYVFDVADFTFSDPDGGIFQDIQIVTLPNKGQVKFNGTAVTAGDTIAVEDFANLVFSPNANEVGFPYTDFEFAVGDGTGFSTPATLIITVNFPINTTTIDGFNNITLSPNPVSEIANLRIETEVKKSATLSVQNIAGQVVLNQNIELNGDFNAAINVSDWTKGVYIVRLQTIDGEVWTEKLIVQ